jgi:hypothetical protein
MKINLAILALACGSVLSAQYAASTSGSTTAAAEINSKPAIQGVSGAPSGLNCTNGKDFYVDTTAHALYQCSVTGAPGSWVLVSPAINGTNAQGLTSNGAGGYGTPVTFPAFPLGTIVGTTDTQTLTNKIVDGVTPTVFGYLDPTSSVQAQLNAKLSASSDTVIIVPFPISTCAGSNSASGLNLPAVNGPTPNCITSGTNLPVEAELNFNNGINTTAYYKLFTPSDIDCSQPFDLIFWWRAVPITGTVTWGAKTSFVGVGSTGDASWNTSSTVTHAPQGTTLQRRYDSITSIPVIGCAANTEMNIAVYRSGSTDSMTDYAQLLSLRFAYSRTQPNGY